MSVDQGTFRHPLREEDSLEFILSSSVYKVDSVLSRIEIDNKNTNISNNLHNNINNNHNTNTNLNKNIHQNINIFL